MFFTSQQVGSHETKEEEKTVFPSPYSLGLINKKSEDEHEEPSQGKKKKKGGGGKIALQNSSDPHLPNPNHLHVFHPIPPSHLGTYVQVTSIPLALRCPVLFSPLHVQQHAGRPLQRQIGTVANSLKAPMPSARQCQNLLHS